MELSFREKKISPGTKRRVLILAAVFHIGDRFEGIGVCIVTDYDAGHGGEEAIYLSIAATVLWLVAAVLVLIGNFKQMLKPKEEAAV